MLHDVKLLELKVEKLDNFALSWICDVTVPSKSELLAEEQFQTKVQPKTHGCDIPKFLELFFKTHTHFRTHFFIL